MRSARCAGCRRRCPSACAPAGACRGRCRQRTGGVPRGTAPSRPAAGPARRSSSARPTTGRSSTPLARGRVEVGGQTPGGGAAAEQVPVLAPDRDGRAGDVDEDGRPARAAPRSAARGSTCPRTPRPRGRSPRDRSPGTAGRCRTAPATRRPRSSRRAGRPRTRSTAPRRTRGRSAGRPWGHPEDGSAVDDHRTVEDP